VTSTIGRLPPVRAARELRNEFDRTVFVLATGDLVASFGFSLIFPFLTIYLTTELGASAAEAGVILGAYAVASIGSTAVGGWLADRIGRKIVMVVSITCTAVVIIGLGQTRDLVGVAVLTLVLGLVDPPFMPAARAAIADVVPLERRPRAYALLSMAASVGWILGPSIGAGLSVLGYPVLFTLAGLIVGTYSVILIVGLRETRPMEVRPEGTPITALPHAIDPPRARRPSGSVAAFLLLVVLIHAVSFQWVVTLPVYAYRDLGISTATWGLMFALNGIIILVFQLRISTASEGRSAARFMALGMVGYLVGYLVVALVSAPALAVPVLAATVVIVTIGEMCVFPLEPTYVADRSPVDLRGRYQGYLGAAMGLGSAIGPPVGGAILDLAPGPAVWVFFAGVAAVAALGLARLGRHDVDADARHEAAARLPAA
jgi:MFS family permease